MNYKHQNNLNRKKIKNQILYLKILLLKIFMFRAMAFQAPSSLHRTRGRKVAESRLRVCPNVSGVKKAASLARNHTFEPLVRISPW